MLWVLPEVNQFLRALSLFLVFHYPFESIPPTTENLSLPEVPSRDIEGIAMEALNIQKHAKPHTSNHSDESLSQMGARR